MWEYRIEAVKGSRERQADAMNILGASGWELVSVENMQMYFKRWVPN